MSGPAERLYERVLVVRCQTGEEGALAELIARYSPRLRFYLRNTAGDAAADDLLQDVWIDVFASISRLKDPGAIAAWVYRIARDKAYAELSRLRRRPFVTVDEEFPDPASDVEEEWTAADAEHVRAALDELPPEQREVIVLRFVEAMSYEQIAAVVVCPVGTVRSRIFYAKRALRDAMQRRSLGKDKRI